MKISCPMTLLAIIHEEVARGPHPHAIRGWPDGERVGGWRWKIQPFKKRTFSSRFKGKMAGMCRGARGEEGGCGVEPHFHAPLLRTSPANPCGHQPDSPEQASAKRERLVGQGIIPADIPRIVGSPSCVNLRGPERSDARNAHQTASDRGGAGNCALSRGARGRLGGRLRQGPAACKKSRSHVRVVLALFRGWLLVLTITVKVLRRGCAFFFVAAACLKTPAFRASPSRSPTKRALSPVCPIRHLSPRCRDPQHPGLKKKQNSHAFSTPPSRFLQRRPAAENDGVGRDSACPSKCARKTASFFTWGPGHLWAGGLHLDVKATLENFRAKATRQRHCGKPQFLAPSFEPNVLDIRLRSGLGFFQPISRTATFSGYPWRCWPSTHMHARAHAHTHTLAQPDR